MNNASETVPPAPAAAPEVFPARAGRASRLALLLAMAALAGVLTLAGALWRDYTRIEGTRQELARRLTDSELAQREAVSQAQLNRATLDALQAKLGVFEAQLAEMQSQQLALQSMYQELSRTRDDRLLAEIEQTVTIAAQQLQFAGNVEAALIALQGAEARLAKSAQPQFLPLRKLILRNIERLKALPSADVGGIALKLDRLIDAVPNLPLAFEQRPAVAPKREKPGARKPQASPPEAADAVPPAPTFASMVQAWLGEVWHELRQLVRIERLDRPDPGLLTPRESFFLRENLRLRLLTARLALLARDGRSFRSDLQQADAWLTRYFDTRAESVREAQQSLRALARLDVMQEPLELNETLAAVRNFKLSRERGSTR